MNKKDITTSLDFTRIFAPKAKSPEVPKRPKKVPEESVIGAKALKKGGYFVNITNPRVRRIASPDKATVLIVEDEPSTLLLIDHVVSKAGYRTRKAATGATFVTSIRIAPIPYQILLDLELPDVSGVVILTKLRANAQAKNIPIVVLSATTTGAYRAPAAAF